MYLFYFDESGDSGYKNSPTTQFSLATLVVRDVNWLDLLDIIIRFRKRTKDETGFNVRDEMKAIELIHGKGPWRDLGIDIGGRLHIYREVFRLLNEICDNNRLDVRVFAVCIDKRCIEDRSKNPRDLAWTFALQRVERFLSKMSDFGIILPDDGYPDFIRKKLRQLRRFSIVPSAYTSSFLKRNLKMVIEDPVIRNSKESYFIQITDLLAYAAHRYVIPTDIVDSSFWHLLGKSILTEVNIIRGGPPGIVVWPARNKPHK